MDPYHSVGMVILAIILVLLNAFFVLSEFAIVKVRRSKLEELGKQGGSSVKLAIKISQSLDSYLSATQLGITLSSIALGWVGDSLSKIIFRGLEIFVDNPSLLSTVSLVVSFCLVTFLHVILGEIVPKSIAIAKSESAALAVVRPLYVFYVIFYPVIKLFDYFASLFLKLLQVKENNDAHSDEELKIIVGESLRGGFLDSIEGEIIKNAVDFSDTVAREIMIPRKDMICLDKMKSYEDNINVLVSHNLIKYPYCDGSKDKMIGMVHIHDLFISKIRDDMSMANFDSIVKDMIIVSEKASISKILIKMHEKKNYSALVVDEYGGTAGLVTMEDILREVLGNIDGSKNHQIKKIGENSYEVNGMMELEDLQELLNLTSGEDSDQVTVGGYVLNLFGNLPKVNDSISDGECVYTILAIEEARVKKLKITLNAMD